MIGDDLVNDVGGAQHCGIKGVQVRTGKYRSVMLTIHKYLQMRYQLVVEVREKLRDLKTVNIAVNVLE